MKKIIIEFIQSAFHENEKSFFFSNYFFKLYMKKYCFIQFIIKLCNFVLNGKIYQFRYEISTKFL
jgi:hypothetical protein